MMEGGGGEGILVVFPLSLMSLSTLVNISESARSCIICEVELQADTLSDTHTELKMIVTLALGCYSSSTTIFPWFNGTGEDKGDGLNTEGRVGKKIKKRQKI